MDVWLVKCGFNGWVLLPHESYGLLFLGMHQIGLILGLRFSLSPLGIVQLDLLTQASWIIL